jgi:hypothetical protein
MKPGMSSKIAGRYPAIMGFFPCKQTMAMKSTQLLFLTLVLLQAAVSGCHAPSGSTQFSEVPDYMGGPAKPREAVAVLDIVGAQPGLANIVLLKGIRKAMGPSSDTYPEEDMMRDARKLADCALAGEKITLRVPRDMASELAHKLEQAGLIVRSSE